MLPKLLFLWALTLAIGFGGLMIYSTTPGQAQPTGKQWPTESRLTPDTALPTLVMVAHPQCPCTRASISELEILMSHTKGKLRAYVLFFKPSSFEHDWEKTDLWKQAARIPGVSVVSDTDGNEAELFGGGTSGQTFLYSPQNQLVFSGGITPSRGHQGDNAGRSAITRYVRGQASGYQKAFTFGCPIFREEQT